MWHSKCKGRKKDVLYRLKNAHVKALIAIDDSFVLKQIEGVKEEAEDKPADKPAGDDSDKSPATGESVASVAAVAALMGAAFVLVRKSKKA